MADQDRTVPGRPELSSRFFEFMCVGGGTLVLFPLLWLLRARIGLDAAELAVGFTAFYAAYLINDPHFSVTYLLFYRDARRRAFGAELGTAQRIRYLVAGLLVPAALIVWAIVALTFQSAEALGWMIQLMFLLVGWHYVKQGFGVVVILSARRGHRLSPVARAVILIHCYAGWAYAWASPAIAAGQFEEKGIVFTAVARPPWLELGAGAALGLSVALLIWVLVAEWRREGRTLPWVPLGGFLITVWAWTIYSSIDPLMRYVIPALHSIQYLYFVWLMKRNEARESELPPLFGRPVGVQLGLLALSALGLAWVLFHGAPESLDALFAPPTLVGTTSALGETPYLAAVYVIVNIHHYFMDHVIWRRDNPSTRYLREPDPGAS